MSKFKCYIIVLAIYCFFPRLVGAQSSIATGIVYVDRNENGKIDKGEQPLNNIGVSNGRDVSITDKSGKYTLTINPGDVIFVIKPSGYNVVLNANNLPAFYYLYSPNGSPIQKYKGINPTGKVPKSIDFGLISQSESKSFRIIVFGDPQSLNEKELDYFDRGIVNEVVNSDNNISFGITMGDMAYDSLDILPKYIDKIKRIGAPWYHTGGNHDINFDATSDEFGNETYKSFFGPITYSFNYANVHFIVLNNVIYKGGSYAQVGDYQGGFRKGQLEFIENDLKHVSKDKLIVLVSHIPYVGREGNPTIRKNDLNKLFTLLKEYNHTFSIAAHMHTQAQRFIKTPYFKNMDMPYHHQYIIGTTSGNLYSGVPDTSGIPPSTMADGTAKGYAYIHFDDNKYTIDYKVAGEDNAYKMHVQMPKVLLRHPKTRASFYVNYYLGGDMDSLSYRVNGGSWNNLNPVLENDPLFQQIIFEWDRSFSLLKGKRPSPPTLCTHLWKGMLYADGKDGTQEVEIAVKDMFGRTFTRKYYYELTSQQHLE